MNASFIKTSKYPLLRIIGVLFLWLITSVSLTYSQQIAPLPPLVSEKISAALILADEIRRTQPLKFQQIMQDLAIRNDLNKEQQHLYNFLLGYSYVFKGYLNRAEKQLKNILSTNANKLIKFRASYTLVHVYSRKKMWFEGLVLIANNIKASKLINNSVRYNEHLTTTILFYNKMKQYDLSLYYIKELSAQNLPPKIDCIAKQLSLQTKFYLNRLSSNDPEITIALKSCESLNEVMVTSIIRIYQARAYLVEKNTNGALDSLFPYIEEIKGTHYPELTIGLNNTLAQIYWQANDIISSKNYAEEALLTNKNNTNVNQASKAYRVLYQIAKRKNDDVLALNYHEKYAELERIYSDGIKTKNLAFQLAKNKKLIQQNEIYLLNEKNNSLAVKQVLVETQVLNRYLLLILLSFIIVSLTVFSLRLWRENKRVKELAEYDPLTGIFNRGHFSQVAPSVLKYCQNTQQDLCLIIFDLDHFKRVNDSFGHACGDWALKKTTEACEGIGRKNDIFARLGGEEFCIILPGCNIDTAMIRAEDCRTAIKDIITEVSGCDFTITASFGVTDVKRSGYNLEQLIADADLASYVSKHAGRNRVTMFQVPTKNTIEKLDSSWGYN